MTVVPPPIVSPASNESDFLASHLGALLLRQPSISTAPTATSTSAAADVASPPSAEAGPGLTPSASDSVLLPAAEDPVSITALRVAAEEEAKARRLARNHSRKLSTVSAGPSSHTSSAALTRSVSAASSPECPSTPAPKRKAHVRSLTSFNVALATSPFTASPPPPGLAAATSPSKSTSGFYTRFGGPRRPSVEASYDSLGLRRKSPSQSSDAGSVSGAAPCSPSLSRASSSCGEEPEETEPHGFGFSAAGGRAGESVTPASPGSEAPTKHSSMSMTSNASPRHTTTMMTSRPKLTQRASTSFSLTLPRLPKEERPMPRVLVLGNTSEDQETLVPVSGDGRTFRFVGAAPTSPKAASPSSAQGGSRVDFGGYSLAAPLQIANSSSERAKEKARAMHAQRSASEGAVRASESSHTSRSSSVSSASGSGSEDASPAVSEGNTCPGLTPSGRTGSPSSSLPSGSSSSPDTPSDVRGPSPSNDADQPRSLKSRRARETNPLDAQVRKEGLSQTMPDLAQIQARA